MSKILKVKFSNQCNGCELCVMEIQRQLSKIGLDGALIRVFKDQKNHGEIRFSLELDPRVNSLNIEKIKNICPKNVYEITEEENAEFIK